MGLFDKLLAEFEKTLSSNEISDTSLYRFFDKVFPIGPRVLKVGWQWLLEKGPTKTAVELIMQYSSPDLKRELLERLSSEAAGIAYPPTRKK